MCVCVRAREKEGFEIEKGPRREILSRSPDKWAEFGAGDEIEERITGEDW